MSGQSEHAIGIEGSWLLLRAGGRDYAINADLIREVVALPGEALFLPVPRPPRAVHGALVVHGRPVPAVCLAEWLSGQRPAGDSPAALAVLALPDLELGLAVEAVYGPGGLAAFGTGPEGAEPAAADAERFVQGQGILESWTVSILDGDALLASLRGELGGELGEDPATPEDGVGDKGGRP